MSPSDVMDPLEQFSKSKLDNISLCQVSSEDPFLFACSANINKLLVYPFHFRISVHRMIGILALVVQ